MKLPRLTTRGLLILVFLVAIALGLDGMRRRRVEFSSRMASHSKQYRVRLGLVAGDVWSMPRFREAGLPDPIKLALIRYHFEMAEKYERAARYPWLPVAPDPPEPTR